jgi:FAD/FMN-containing dehydrogenase
LQKFEGGSIKHDVSVPIAKAPDFLDAVIAAVEARVPGARMCPFGHLGDGNIHCNVSQPVGADKQAFLDRWHEVNAIVHAIVLQSRRVATREGSGVPRCDARHQVDARPQEHSQSWQGALAEGNFAIRRKK